MIIDDIDFELQQGKRSFTGKIINITTTNFYCINSFENIPSLTFISCVFNGPLEIQDLNKQNFKLTFRECTFNGDILIDNFEIDSLFFINTKKIKTINITGVFNRLRFNNKAIPLVGEISISNCIILKELNLDNLYLKEGDFNMQFNDVKDYNYENFKSSFKNAIIFNIEIVDSFFGTFANFRNVKILNNLIFDDCKFNKLSFKLASFGNFSNFNDCKFYSYSGFEECKNLETTNLKISACLFTSFPHFNGSEFNHLEISHTTFERKTSFDSLIVKSLKLNQVTFLQGAYFDDIQIKKISDCDRKTIRTIKQELQKAENRIDFNRFRNYELIAHYKELSFKNNFKDKFILWATKWSSNYGSWTWALWFTILSGLFWYSILYRIENSGVFNFEKTNEFFVGSFRFFLVTDFFNPLENDRTYLENGWSWLIFILGKIFIAFGIYEMIQSFRKFKA
jgi:hypothetical protein